MSAYVVQTAEEKILRAFTAYPYLTVEQLTRCLYSSGSARYVSASSCTASHERQSTTPMSTV